MKLFYLTLVAALASICIISISSGLLGCEAQAMNREPTKQAAPVAQAKKSLMNSLNPEFNSQRLEKPVDLPNIPPFAGKNVEFVTGTLFPAVKGGPSVTMQFSVRNDCKEVLTWYQTAFSEYKWQMLSDMTGANGLSAMNSHNICQVMTLGPSKNGAKCDLLIRYKFYKPTSF